jgi:hypothetical protein
LAHSGDLTGGFFDVVGVKLGEGLGVFGVEVVFEEVVWWLLLLGGGVVKCSGGDISFCCDGGRVAHFCARAVVALVAS